MESFLTRRFYIILSITFSAFAYIFFIFSAYKKWIALPENIIFKFIVLFSVPLVFILLYFTSFKKIFPQRLGDCLQSILSILIISVANSFFEGRIGINGPFFGAFILLITFYIFLLDYFLPLFIGGVIVLFLLIEFFLVGTINSLSASDLIFEIISVLSVAFVTANLIRRMIIERKTKEQLQIAYLDLQRLDRAKSEFVSIASHQLRTPLTAIKGYISMILEGTYGKVPEKSVRPLENVSQSNERLIKLVNDLLNVSRIEAGKLEMNYEKVTIDEIVKSVFEELKNEAGKKKLYLKLEESKEALPKIFVDKDKFRQVILNLFDNAIRYTEKGGITVKLKAQSEKLKIEISDTGEGMNEEEIEKMFTSFSRGTAGTKLYTEGAGLGLYVAKKFVEMHQGKIWAESVGKGKGTTFYIELPIK